jgi:hypothetical protein
VTADPVQRECHNWPVAGCLPLQLPEISSHAEGHKPRLQQLAKLREQRQLQQCIHVRCSPLHGVKCFRFKARAIPNQSPHERFNRGGGLVAVVDDVVHLSIFIFILIVR